MKYFMRLFLISIAILLSGCASKYVPLYEEDAKVTIGWPLNQPKIVYKGSLTGFAEEGKNGVSTLRAIAFGRESKGLFSNPVAFSLGEDGRMAVADRGAKCVHLYIPQDKSYQRITRAGKGMAFKSPVSVAFDREGRMYVTDSMLRRVVVFDREGQFQKVISGVDGEEFLRPTGLTFDPSRRALYLVDTMRHKVFVMDRIGAKLFEFGGRGSQKGNFNFPTHICFGPDRRVYVTDAMNFRIQIFSSHGDFIGSFGHHGDGSGDFAMPKGVAVDKKGVIYVVDALFDNVQLFNEWGDFLLTVGKRGRGPGEFWLPSGVFIDNRHNRLYVCDTFNKRVQIFEIRD